MFKNLTKSEITTIILDSIGCALLAGLAAVASASANKERIDEQVDKRFAELQASTDVPDEQ